MAAKSDDDDRPHDATADNDNNNNNDSNSNDSNDNVNDDDGNNDHDSGDHGKGVDAEDNNDTDTAMNADNVEKKKTLAFFRGKIAAVKTKVLDGMDKLSRSLSSPTDNQQQQLQQQQHLSPQQQQQQQSGAVFGRPLELVDLVEGVPVVVHTCVRYLRSHCIALTGLFRVPGSQIELKALRSLLNHNPHADLVQASDDDVFKTPHSVAALLKLYLRELPEPLLTYEYYDCFIAANGVIVPQARLDCIKKILVLLPPRNLSLLIYLIRFLKEVSAHADENKMPDANLAMVFAPNLLQSRDTSFDIAVADTPHASKLMETLLQDFDVLFQGITVEEKDLYASRKSMSSFSSAEQSTEPSQSAPDLAPSTASPIIDSEIGSVLPTPDPSQSPPKSSPLKIRTVTKKLSQLNNKLVQSLSRSPKDTPSFVSDGNTGPACTTTTTTTIFETTPTATDLVERTASPVGPRPNPFLVTETEPS